MSETDDIIRVPLDEIGLDPRFRVRDVDYNEVTRLTSEWNDALCEPLWVRPWPRDDSAPRPAGCERATYQVASGFQRRTAAAQRGITMLRVISREMDDAQFLAWAIRGNQAHGKRMSDDEMLPHLLTLKAAGWTQEQIARESGVSQSKISRMLSGADSNASRKRSAAFAPGGAGDVMRTHTSDASGMRTHEQQEDDDEQRAASEREITHVGVALSRVYAAALDELRPAAVRAYLATLNDDELALAARQAMSVHGWLRSFVDEVLTTGQRVAAKEHSA